MYPNEEFLPRAPDPEELVLDGDDESKPDEGSSDSAAAKSEEWIPIVLGIRRVI